MATLYRPNHRYRGPMESDKFRMSRKAIYDGTVIVQNKLNRAYETWDDHFNGRLIGKTEPVASRQTLLDWHGPAGSFLYEAYTIHTEETRLHVIPVSRWEDVIQRLDEADILAIGIGSLPEDLSTDKTQAIEKLIGRTPLVIGRLLLPHLQSRWKELNIYKSFDRGSEGQLVAYGWDPPIYRNRAAESKSTIPNDELASVCPSIISGEGEHRFFVSLAPLTLISSLGIGISPNEATDEEMFMTYEAIQQWFSPSVPRVRPVWTRPFP